MRKTVLVFGAVLFAAIVLLNQRKASLAADYGSAERVWIKPGISQSKGIRLLFNERLGYREVGEKKCVATDGKKGNNFISFDVDDSFILNGSSPEAVITIEYFDGGADSLALQYDAGYGWPADEGFERAGRVIQKNDTKTWKTYTARISNVRFANRQGYGPADEALLDGGGSDFRINSRADGDECISYAEVRIPVITAQPNEAGNIFDEKGDIAITIRINNREDAPLEALLKYQVSDYRGRMLSSGEQQLTVPKQTSRPHEIAVAIDAYGVFTLDAQLVRGDAVREECETSFAVCGRPVASQSMQLPFGVNIMTRSSQITQIIRTLRRLGVRWVRYPIRPRYTTIEGDAVIAPQCDAVVNALHAGGMQSSVILLGSTGSDPTTGQTAAIGDFAAFAAWAVARYGGTVKHWEIWNEPDMRGFWPGGPDAANYAKLLIACHRAIKHIDPSATVAIGGLGSRQTHRFWFLDHLYEHKAGAAFDAVAIHPYTQPHPPEHDQGLERKIDDVAARLRQRGHQDRGVSITEIGWPTALHDASSVSLGDQASLLVRSYIIACSYPSVGNIFWHNFRNSGMDETSPYQNFGLLYNDFTPKPAAIAYLNLVNQLGGLQYEERLDLDTGVRGYGFRNEQRVVRVVWSPSGKKMVRIPVAGTAARLVDIMGNVSELPVTDGQATFFVNEEPLYIVEDREGKKDS